MQKQKAEAVAAEEAATVANLAAEKIQAMLRRRETPLSPTTELFELPAKDADAHAANGASSTPDVNPIDKDPSEDVDPIDKDPSESKHGDGKPKRRRRKKPQPGLFWNLGKAPRAAKHATRNRICPTIPTRVMRPSSHLTKRPRRPPALQMSSLLLPRILFTHLR